MTQANGQYEMTFTEDLDQQIKAQKEFIDVLDFKLDDLEDKAIAIDNEYGQVMEKRQIALQELSRLKGIKKTTSD